MQWIVGLFFAVTVALFALQNTAPVTVRFLVFSLEGVGLALVILVTAALAASATMLLGLTRSVRHGAQVRDLRRELAERDAQIAQLHAQALVSGTASGAEPSGPEASLGTQEARDGVTHPR